jgi:RHS repeat-associated protein
MNGDGLDDLVFADEFSVPRLRLMSRGDGTFGELPLFFSQPAPWERLAHECTAGDINGDRRGEFVCTYTDALGRSSIGVAEIARDGLSVSVTSFDAPVEATEIGLGDVDADGHSDVVLSRATFNNPMTIYTGYYVGALIPSFHWVSTPTGWTLGSSETADLITRDISGDDRADVVVQRTHVGLGGARTVAVHIATSEKLGSVAVMVVRPDVTPAGWRTLIGDVDGDGAADVVGTDTDLTVQYSRHDGTFSPPAVVRPLSKCRMAAFIADVNGDGREDVICGNHTNSRPGRAEFHVDSDLSPLSPADPSHWMAGDFNGDGRHGFALVSYRNPGYQVYTARPGEDGTLTAVAKPVEFRSLGIAPADPETKLFVPADVGSARGAVDGRTDLVRVEFVDGSLRITTLLNDGDRWIGVVDTPWRLGGPSGSVVPYPRRDAHHWRATDLNADGFSDLFHMSAIPAGGVRLEYLLARGDGTWENGFRDSFTGSVPAAPAGPFPSWDADDSAFHIVDLNLDGTSDITHLQLEGPGDKPTSYTLRTLVSSGPAQWTEEVQNIVRSSLDRRSWQRLQAADLNGDGVTDLAQVILRDGCVSLEGIQRSGTGWQVEPTVRRSGVCAPSADVADSKRLMLTDIDNDSRIDAVHISSSLDAAGTRSATILAITSTAKGTLHARQQLTLPSNFVDSWAWTTADADSNNQADLVHLGPDWTRVHGTEAPDEVVAINNGLGMTTRVSYRPQFGGPESLPELYLPRVVDTVTTIDDAYSPPAESTGRWSYSGGDWSESRRQLRGFQDVTATEGTAAAHTHHDLSDQCGIRPLSIIREGGGHILSKDGFVYGPLTAGGAQHCEVMQRTAAVCEGQPSCQEMVVDYGYDRYGRAETVDELSGGLRRRMYTPTKANDAAHIIDKPARRELLRGTPNGWQSESKTLFGYDELGLTAGMGDHGDLTQTAEFTDLQSGATVDTSARYDSVGNRIWTTNGQGATTTIYFDRRRNLFPTSECSVIGCTVTTWDEARGLPIGTIDLNKGTSDYVYDAHGRTIQQKHPGTGPITTLYLDAGRMTGGDDQHQRVRTEQADGSAGDGILWREELRDGHGRVYRTRVEGSDPSQIIISDMTYFRDTTSPATQTAPHISTEISQTTVQEHDDVGRPTRVVYPGGQSATSFAYGVGVTEETDESGRHKRTLRDGFGRAKEITESTTACAGCIPDIRTVTYDYDSSDRLTEIRDDAGKITIIKRDALGRDVLVSDPDRGTTTKEWNEDGTIRVERDALRVRTWAYDKAGRPISRTDSSPTGGPTAQAYWSWDVDPLSRQPLGASMGRVTQTFSSFTPPDGVSTQKRTSYTPAGQKSMILTCVDDVCAEMNFSYDQAGRLAAAIYPPEKTGQTERVEYTYDAQGHPFSVGGYVTSTEHNEIGQLTRRHYGNGFDELLTYEPSRHWLTTQVVAATSGSSLPSCPQPQCPISNVPNGPIAYAASYDHREDGRISAITTLDIGGPAPTRAVTERYTYDGFGQLVETRNDTDQGGNRSYAYDSAGRIIRSLTSGNYRYDDPAHPHAVTSTSAGSTRTYDEMGNVLHKTDPGGRDVDFSWSLGDVLTRQTDHKSGLSEEYGYDEDGSRVKEVTASGTRYYIGKFLEITSDGKWTKNYWEGDQQVAVRQPDESVQYLLYDSSHSLKMVSSNAGDPILRPKYAAYGERLDKPQPASTGVAAWQGHPSANANGLIYMNARYYDPELGTFASADSIVPSASKAATLNRYSYTANDPINSWDPTGHSGGTGDDKYQAGWSERYYDFDHPLSSFSPLASYDPTPSVSQGESEESSSDGSVSVDCQSCTLLGVDPPEQTVWDKIMTFGERFVEAIGEGAMARQAESLAMAEAVGRGLEWFHETFHLELEALAALPAVGVLELGFERAMMLEVQVFRGSKLIHAEQLLSGAGGLLAHAEMKAVGSLLERNILRAGDEVFLYGGYDICSYGLCRSTLNNLARAKGINVLYYGFTRETGSRTFFQAGVGHIPMKLLEKSLKLGK